MSASMANFTLGKAPMFSAFTHCAVRKVRSCSVLFHQKQMVLHHPACRRKYCTKRNILELHERGIFQDIYPQTTDELPKKLNGAPQTIYCGVDPTAESLHIGNLLPLIGLLHCHRAGHKCVIVIGGATALVGDPSGKTNERASMDKDTIEKYTESIHESLDRIISNHKMYLWKGGHKKVEDIRILNNLDWYNSTQVVNFMATVGRYIRLSDMLSRQSVKSRLNSPEGMSYAEFSYQALQAYDFLYLHSKHNCLLQIGGNDQIGNMVTGHDLIKRATGKSVYGLTVPLLTTAGGRKLGKTAGNAVWINEDKTSKFDLYQYFVRLPDADMENYLKLLTFLPLSQIEDIMTRHRANPELRGAQKKLAEHVMKLVHGDEGLEKALLMTDALYHSNPLEALSHLSSSDMEELFSGATLHELFIEPGETVFDIAMRIKCLPEGMKGEKIVREGGFYINQKKVQNPEQALIKGEHVLQNGITLFRVGKKKYHIVKWV